MPELHSEKINWRNTDLWLNSCKLQVNFFTQCCSGTVGQSSVVSNLRANFSGCAQFTGVSEKAGGAE
ncbi:MAG: hypothetical protein EBV15_08935 [Bacteroidetes bacterium]|nr:hypothetical protein [Bacteroidota bacterium]